MLISYARVSTDGQDFTAQRDALAELGVGPSKVDVNHGLTDTVENARPPGPAKRPDRRGQEPSAAWAVGLSAWVM